MKAMVLESTFEESNSLATMICLGGHQVVEAIEARTVSSAAAPQVCFIGTACDEQALVEHVKRLRATNAKLIIVLLGAELGEATLTRLYDAGLDLDLHQPLTTPYLLTRLRVLERQFQLPPPRATTSNIPVSRTGKLPKIEASATNPLTTFLFSSAWQHAPKNLQRALGNFFTLPASIAEVTSLPVPPTLGKQIMLSSTEHQIELRAAIGTDLGSARHLAMHLFGSDDDELAIDMLGEIANIFMGTLKAEFSSASLAITGGLPADLDPEQVLRPSVIFNHQESFMLVLDTARIVVHLGMRAKANVFLPPLSLAEGMILAKDLHNGRGMLVLSKGTRLSMTMVEKVRCITSPVSRIEVMAP